MVTIQMHGVGHVLLDEPHEKVPGRWEREMTVHHTGGPTVLTLWASSRDKLLVEGECLCMHCAAKALERREIISVAAERPTYCEHCGDGPTCGVCGRGQRQLTQGVGA